MEDEVRRSMSHECIRSEDEEHGTILAWAAAIYHGKLRVAVEASGGLNSAKIHRPGTLLVYIGKYHVKVTCTNEHIPSTARDYIHVIRSEPPPCSHDRASSS